jgi:hypothetical protein
MEESTRKNLFLLGSIVLILVAGIVLFLQASKPKETINDYSKIPPKGIGKYEKNDAAGRKGM